MKIALSGSTGRMGQELLNLSESDDLNVVLKIHRDSNLALLKEEFDIMIDFSLPEFLPDLLDFVRQRRRPIVIGTTGLKEWDVQRLKKDSQEIPILWAPNLSLGIEVFAQMLKPLKHLKGFTFKLEEIHHVRKKDSPSGTALYLKDILEKKSGQKHVEVESFREGDVFGIHKLICTGPEEVITIQHEALNRRIFARGALQAAKWLLDKKPGLYGMSDVVEN